MFKAIGRFLVSRKGLLAISACVAAGANGQWWLIPGILMGASGLIAVEDAAAKLRTGKSY